MSFENNIKNNPSEMPPRLEIGLLRYLWSASPLSLNKKSYHKLLSSIPIFSRFSDNEIRVFSKYLHERKFQTKEIIFRQDDSGYGFYFIVSGQVDIFYEKDSNIGIIPENIESVTILKVGDYFGEMGLLEEFNRRNATAVTKKETVLLGLFKPDLDDICNHYPVIGAKFIREISQIMATRMGEILRENMRLKIEMGQ